VRAVYLDAAGEAVAGLLDEPRSPSGIGVLLVPPHGWDDQSAYRPRRDWAEALAAAGHTALRIDLPGTGDSEGFPRDPERLAAWTAAVRAGVDWLRAGGHRRVAIAALGVGGLVTLAAGTDAEEVILWGCPDRGRTAIRELKAFGRLEQTQTGEDPADVPEGEVRAGGHVLAAPTAAAISKLSATELLAGGGPARALVLGRDGVGPDAALLDALRGAGAAVATDPGRGWGAMLPGPQQARAPTDVFALVNRWLAEAAPDGASPVALTAPDSVELEVEGATVRETPISFPGGAGALYGVLAEPVDGEPSGTAVLLNAGAIRHIGPSRMWTETARRWAARGIATLRLDVEGVGEADGDPSPYVESMNLHVEALPRQVVCALDMLAARGLPDRFLLGGMCSGAFWAFQAALLDERVAGVVSLNPRVFFYDPDAEPTRELRRFIRIFTPTGFRYMLMGDRRLLRLWRLVKWLAATPFRAASRRRNPPAPGDPLVDALQLMRDRGQRMDLAFSLEEPLHDTLRAGHRLEDLEAMGVHLYDLPHISHTLKPVAAQRAASEVLDAVAALTFPPRAPRPR
jgi:pimeloyl-ACP methyl ester carboxylesterase